MQQQHPHRHQQLLLLKGREGVQLAYPQQQCPAMGPKQQQSHASLLLLHPKVQRQHKPPALRQLLQQPTPLQVQLQQHVNQLLPGLRVKAVSPLILAVQMCSCSLSWRSLQMQAPLLTPPQVARSPLQSSCTTGLS